MVNDECVEKKNYITIKTIRSLHPASASLLFVTIIFVTNWAWSNYNFILDRNIIF